ncbi:MAG: hypothetical protein ACSNEK_05945 [Parachlamydiaceae bacterium]
MRHSLVLVLLLLSGCAQQTLMVRTEYLSHEDLPSYKIGTPDPRLANPMIGQRLILSWNIPPTIQSYPHLHIKLKVRFKNREESCLSFPIDRLQGLYIYPLLNEEYLVKDGILTYRVELFSDDRLLDHWTHQIWAERILFSDDVIPSAN